ncbi:hypothetical protein RhiirA5_371240 [Rhizophagus irregularis]|uniref:Uncharacterized protein n=1 Tax=Rhizophagus irregularis TaxID=588596 RepID=A0A2N0Q6N6_9GLOM|nr:hypothetical protein RhiirA5_371240 [Rhizophagus irregularis]
MFSRVVTMFITTFLPFSDIARFFLLAKCEVVLGPYILIQLKTKLDFKSVNLDYKEGNLVRFIFKDIHQKVMRKMFITCIFLQIIYITIFIILNHWSNNEIDLTLEINFFVSPNHPFRRFSPFSCPFQRFSPFQSPILKFLPFRSPISKGPFFLVVYFEGSGFRSTGRNCFEQNWYNKTLGSGILKYWTNEISSSACLILDGISRVPDLNDPGLKVSSGS